MHFFAPWPFPGLAALCGAPPGVPIGGVLLLTGLIGGFAHCGAMCGPFVLAQTAGATQLRRLPQALLVPYHCGRMLTYAGLGAAGGGLGAAAIDAGLVRSVSAVLLGAAALGFLSSGIARLSPGLVPFRSGRIAARCALPLARLGRPLLQAGSAPRRFLLGVVLGFLPCGFLYTALAAAAATGSAAAGATGLMLFALGTVPSLAILGIGGAAAAARWRGLAGRAVGPLFLFNGAVLAALAARAASVAALS